METKQHYHLKLAKIKNLPTLPESSCKIITAVNNPDVSIEELTQVISTSTSLTGRLLGLANSAYFGCPGKIVDLRVAIIQVLGLNLVKSLALSILLSNELDVSRCRNFNTLQFWMQNLLTAILAQKIAMLAGDEELNPSVAYTSGLLLNIGLLAIVYVFPEELNQVFLDVEERGSSLNKKIMDEIGVGHYQIGFFLLKRWRLPNIYPDILKQYAEVDGVEEKTELLKMITVLKLSSSLAKQIYVSESQDLPISIPNINGIGVEQCEIQKLVKQLIEKIRTIEDLAISMGGK
jgi:HD-like signal output (HDOD) protein